VEVSGQLKDCCFTDAITSVAMAEELVFVVSALAAHHHIPQPYG